MFKKGQAALEFLTTYGWAFLVILVMIGALAYFGVLNPSKFVPDTCTFSSTFICDDAVIYGGAGGNVTIKLRNNVEAITITSINVTDVDTGYTSEGLGSNLQVGAGEVFTVAVNRPTGLTAGWTAEDKTKLGVVVTYFVTSSGAEFTKSTGGDVVGTVQ